MKMAQDEVLVLALKSIFVRGEWRGWRRCGATVAGAAAATYFINFSTLKMLFIFHGERKIERAK